MTKVSLYVHLEAKPGKEQEVADFLVSALPLVNAGAARRSAWFALRMSPNTFGIFDAFPSEAGPRRASERRGRPRQLMANAARASGQARRKFTRSTSSPTSSRLTAS